MSMTEMKLANAVGGKTARACDSCLRRRARWYCAADDAFLCQACDSSVHSANSLARRHQRLLLKTASLSSVLKQAHADMTPSWHKGFKRKARTPRPHHHTKPTTLAQQAEATARKTEPLVPDLETTSLEDNVEEEQLLYRVPIFDPVFAEFCPVHTASDDGSNAMEAGPTNEEAKPVVQLPEFIASGVTAIGGLPGFLPSDVDLADFAADVDSLLGRGLDEDSFCMEGLGLMESREDPESCCGMTGSGRVKVEMDDVELAVCHMDAEIDLSRETLDLNFDCGSPITGEDAEEEEEKVAADGMEVDGYGEVAMGRWKIGLRLDFEAVIAAWSMQGSLWIDGERPQFNPDDCWPDYMGTWWGGGEAGRVYGGGGEMGVGRHVTGDGGREARVSRYREKRRTRLFSKKIRYEVRKLNAEKRPRMKGRFVKRASFAAAAGVAPPGCSSFHYR